MANKFDPILGKMRKEDYPSDVTPVVDGVYTVGGPVTVGVGVNGVITIVNGIITVIQEAT